MKATRYFPHSPDAGNPADALQDLLPTQVVRAAHKYDARMLLEAMETEAVENLQYLQKELRAGGQDTTALGQACFWVEPAYEMQLESLQNQCMQVLAGQPRLLADRYRIDHITLPMEALEELFIHGMKAYEHTNVIKGLMQS